MKKLLILLTVILLMACTGPTDYNFSITYIDGTQEQLIIHSRNGFITPVNDDGCLKWRGAETSIRCGVRSFTYYTSKP